MRIAGTAYCSGCSVTSATCSEAARRPSRIPVSAQPSRIGRRACRRARAARRCRDRRRRGRRRWAPARDRWRSRGAARRSPGRRSRPGRSRPRAPRCRPDGVALPDRRARAPGRCRPRGRGSRTSGTGWIVTSRPRSSSSARASSASYPNSEGTWSSPSRSVGGSPGRVTATTTPTTASAVTSRAAPARRELSSRGWVGVIASRSAAWTSGSGSSARRIPVPVVEHSLHHARVRPPRARRGRPRAEQRVPTGVEVLRRVHPPRVHPGGSRPPPGRRPRW